MAKLKIAVIGCGKMGKHHLRAIQTLDNAEIIGVVDPLATKEKLGELLPLNAKVFATLDDMFQNAKPDVVHIVTPPASHTNIALQCLEHDINIYVEKPFSLTLQEAEQILNAAKQKNLKVCSAHQVLFQETGQKYKNYTKYIKDIIHIDSYFSFEKVRKTITPTDQLIDILPHPVYLMLSALDEVKDKDAKIEMLSNYVDPAGEVRTIFKKGTATAILNVTLRGRPVESYLKVCGSNGLVNADFVISGITKHLGPGESTIAALVQPFSASVQLTFHTIGNVFKRIFKKHKSYSGLAELVGLYYDSILDDTISPVTDDDILNTVGICETISTELIAKEKVVEEVARQALEEKERLLAATDGNKGTVLITGGTGFQGSVLVEELRSRGWPVRVITRSMPAYSQRIPGVEYVEADLGQHVPDEYFNGVELVAHLAAETAGGKDEHERNTINATKNMIDGAHKAGIRKFINISSLAVLKPSSEVGGPLSESSPADYDNLGRGPYVWGKATAEKLGIDLGEEYDMDIKTIRLGPLVDFENFVPPGRLGKEVGTLFVAMCGKKDKLSVCDIHTAAKAMRSFVEDFEYAPMMLNLIEENAPTRLQLVDMMLAKREELKTFWMPTFLLKFISFMIGLVFRVMGKKPLNVYSAFASEQYDATLAGEIIRKAEDS